MLLVDNYLAKVSALQVDQIGFFLNVYCFENVLYYFVLEHILLLVLTMFWLLTIGRYFTISGQFAEINRRLRHSKHLLNFIDRVCNKFYLKGLQEKSLRIYGICWFIWKRVWCKSDDRSFNSAKGGEKVRSASGHKTRKKYIRCDLLYFRTERMV